MHAQALRQKNTLIYRKKQTEKQIQTHKLKGRLYRTQKNKLTEKQKNKQTDNLTDASSLSDRETDADRYSKQARSSCRQGKVQTIN